MHLTTSKRTDLRLVKYCGNLASDAIVRNSWRFVLVTRWREKWKPASDIGICMIVSWNQTVISFSDMRLRSGAVYSSSVYIILQDILKFDIFDVNFPNEMNRHARGSFKDIKIQITRVLKDKAWREPKYFYSPIQNNKLTQLLLEIFTSVKPSENSRRMCGF